MNSFYMRVKTGTSKNLDFNTVYFFFTAKCIIELNKFSFKQYGLRILLHQKHYSTVDTSKKIQRKLCN